MSEILGTVLVLGCILGALWLMVGRPDLKPSSKWIGGRGPGSGRSVHGYLVAHVLATAATVGTLLDVGVIVGSRFSAVAVGILVLSALGYALAPKMTLFLLSLVGLFGLVVTMGGNYGYAAVIGLIVITTLTLWLAGFLRMVTGGER